MGKRDDVEEVCQHFKNKADFVEVVRCKKCKYNGNFFKCPFDADVKCKEDDFCSYGERRDG
jgi:hypothetical protein